MIKLRIVTVSYVQIFIKAVSVLKTFDHSEKLFHYKDKLNSIYK